MNFLVASNVLRAIGCLAFNLYSWIIVFECIAEVKLPKKNLFWWVLICARTVWRRVLTLFETHAIHQGSDSGTPVLLPVQN